MVSFLLALAISTAQADPDPLAAYAEYAEEVSASFLEKGLSGVAQYLDVRPLCEAMLDLGSKEFATLDACLTRFPGQLGVAYPKQEDVIEQMRTTRLVEENGGVTAIVRVVKPEGFDFLEYQLKPHGDGFLIREWLAYSTATPLIKSTTEALRGKGTGKELQRYSASLQRLRALVAEGDYAAALKAFDDLPVQAQALRPAQAYRLMAAAHAEHHRFQAIAQEFAANWELDAPTALMLFDAYVDAGRVEAAREVVAVVAKRTGEHAAIELFAAAVETAAGNPRAAVNHTLRAVEPRTGLPEWLCHRPHHRGRNRGCGADARGVGVGARA